MSSRKTTVAVIFGGRSVEHDVSVVTGQQIMKALSPTRYEVVPVYITRDGKWFTGEALRDIANFKDDKILTHKDIRPVLLSPDVRHHGLIVNPLPDGLFAKPQVLKIDVLFPAIHGSNGEDGTLQGLFELADIPYVGFATLGSALTNDKIMTKQVLRQNNIAVLDDTWFTRAEWYRNPDEVITRLKAKFALPVFVKPATLGSSIGVSRVDEDRLLRHALDMAFNLDRRVLIEPAVQNPIEINCSVIGFGDEVHASVLEQPLSYADFLAFEDKYLRGNKGMKSADRIIPAPLDDTITTQIQTMAKDAFQAVDGRGIVRIDFLIEGDTQRVVLNEMNTLPGSFSFYLWKPTGYDEPALVEKVIHYAKEAHAEKRRSVTDYKTSLLNVAAARGVKGTKGK
jgi:D-alanine-D-alanine ligase